MLKLVFLFVLFFSHFSLVSGEEAPKCGRVLNAGEFECCDANDLGDPNKPAPELGGLCRYQVDASFGGKGHFHELLGIAQAFAKRIISSSGNNPNNIEPRNSSKGRNIIEWWFEDSEETNLTMGEVLKLNDHLDNNEVAPEIILTLTMFSIERGYEREFGADFGIFYGQREIDSPPPKGLANLTNGIFGASLGIGNPLASFLEGAFRFARNKKKAEQVREVTYHCAIGELCLMAKESTNYFSSSFGVEKEQVGLSISGYPWLARPDDYSELDIAGFSFRYGVPTGEENRPVDVFRFPTRNHFRMETDKIRFVGGESSNYDVRTGKLLGSAKEEGHTKFLVFLKVRIIPPDGKITVPHYEYTHVSQDFTDEEIEMLPNNKHSLKEILSSLKVECFDDLFIPTNQKAICGFSIGLMDQSLIRQMLKIELLGPTPLGNKSTKSLAIDNIFKGDINGKFVGKGFYQLPELDPKSERKYKLRIKLSPSDPYYDLVKEREGMSGIEVEFGHFPGLRNPIRYNSSFIKVLK